MISPRLFFFDQAVWNTALEAIVAINADSGARARPPASSANFPDFHSKPMFGKWAAAARSLTPVVPLRPTMIEVRLGPGRLRRVTQHHGVPVPPVTAIGVRIARPRF